MDNNKISNNYNFAKTSFKISGSDKGLIQTILLVIIVVLVISYFDIDMKKLLESDTTKDNFSFVGSLLHKVWEILKPIWDGLWDIIGPSVKEGIKSQL